MSTRISFSEKVLGIGKKNDSENYNVIFRVRAAIYWIKGDREKEIKILEDASKNNSPINIVCDGITRELLEVNL